MSVVVHHPRRHPFIDNLWGRRAGCSSTPVWDVGRLVADGVRLVHLHFGFEQRSAAELADWVDEVHAARIAVVHTAHDLDNPHLVDQSEFHRAVDVLARSADAVTTLTPAAARALRRRSGVTAAVISHPHVIPIAEVAALGRRPRPRDGIYVHAGPARPNLDLDAIARLVARPGQRTVLVHVRPTAPAATLDALARLARRGRLVLDVGARLSDADLWRRLASCELLLLPYRWGTHSGLLEAAHDVGTPVLAPAFGGYGDQGATTYEVDPTPDVDAALASRPTTTVAGRCRDRDRARTTFAAIHRAAMRVGT